MNAPIETIGVAWERMAEACGPVDQDVLQTMRLCFYSGYAASMARLLSCPSEMRGFGLLTIDAAGVESMRQEILAAMGPLFGGEG
jgi:hypothetical protein